MEEKSIFGENSNQQANNLEVDWLIADLLTGATKWAKFLGILGFIGTGFLVIVSFFVGTLLRSSLGYNIGASIVSSSLTIVYLIGAVLLFFPSSFLYKFSVDTKNALAHNNQSLLGSGFKNLKSYFTFNGVIALIVLIFYAFGILFGVIAAFASI